MLVGVIVIAADASGVTDVGVGIECRTKTWQKQEVIFSGQNFEHKSRHVITCWVEFYFTHKLQGRGESCNLRHHTLSRWQLQFTSGATLAVASQ